MDELIERLRIAVGITEEQAVKAVEVVKDYAKEKFPMFSGAIENVFNKNAGDKDEFMP